MKGCICPGYIEGGEGGYTQVRGHALWLIAGGSARVVLQIAPAALFLPNFRNFSNDKRRRPIFVYWFLYEMLYFVVYLGVRRERGGFK